MRTNSGADLFYNQFSMLAYEGEEGGGEAGSEGGEGGGEGGQEKLIPESEMNRHLAGLRRKTDSQLSELKQLNEELVNQNKKLMQTATDPEEVESYKAEIERLSRKYMTEAELKERESQKKEKELSEQLERLTQERDSFKSEFQREVERSEFVSAAARYDAYDPEHIAAILRSDTEWKEVESDDGKKVRRPRVNFRDTTKEGQPVTMDFTIEDAIKRMRELPDRFGHLFKSGLEEGSGGQGNRSAKKEGEITFDMIEQNPALYRKIRKEDPALFEKLMQEARVSA